VRTALAGPSTVLVEEVSSTVTSTPVAVFMVKPEAEVASMMPVEPPSAGPATGAPPGGAGVVAAVAVPEAASTTADASPAASHPRFRLVGKRLARTALVAVEDSSDV
jgi:hypothetical protein